MQPALTADGDVLIGTASGRGGIGMRRSRSRTDPADGPSKSAGRRTG